MATKHIHIHLHRAATRDDEYKRDAGGRFASSQASMTAAAQHRTQRAALPLEHPDRKLHASIAAHHELAAAAGKKGDLSTAHAHTAKAQEIAQRLNGASSPVHAATSDPGSVAHGGRAPQPGELKELYHTTSPETALKILQSRKFASLHQLDPQAAHEIYGLDGSGDGGHFVYTGTSSEASQAAAVGGGVTFKLDATGHEHRTVMQPDQEGGIALHHGELPVSTIRGVEFHGDHPLNAKIDALLRDLSR